MCVLRFLFKLLLVSTFLYSGITQIFTYKAMQGYVLTQGAFHWLNEIMAPLLFLAIIVDLVGSAFILLNYKARVSLVFLAIYTLLLNLYFNMHFSDINSTIIFMLELSLSGGLLYIALTDKELK